MAEVNMKSILEKAELLLTDGPVTVKVIKMAEDSAMYWLELTDAQGRVFGFAAEQAFRNQDARKIFAVCELMDCIGFISNFDI